MHPKQSEHDRVHDDRNKEDDDLPAQEGIPNPSKLAREAFKILFVSGDIHGDHAVAQPAALCQNKIGNQNDEQSPTEEVRRG